MDPRQIAAVYAGGMVGALARVELSVAFPAHAGAWPWMTLSINTVGAALLGYLATRFQERLAPSTYPRPFVGTGLCGALTTFSTMQIEAVRLARDGYVPTATAYLAVSVVAGVAAVSVGTVIARRGGVGR
jgi:fluoride exporter